MIYVVEIFSTYPPPYFDKFYFSDLKKASDFRKRKCSENVMTRTRLQYHAEVVDEKKIDSYKPNRIYIIENKINKK